MPAVTGPSNYPISLPATPIGARRPTARSRTRPTCSIRPGRHRPSPVGGVGLVGELVDEGRRADRDGRAPAPAKRAAEDGSSAGCRRRLALRRGRLHNHRQRPIQPAAHRGQVADQTVALLPDDPHPLEAPSARQRRRRHANGRPCGQRRARITRRSNSGQSRSGPAAHPPPQGPWRRDEGAHPGLPGAPPERGVYFSCSQACRGQVTLASPGRRRPARPGHALARMRTRASARRRTRVVLRLGTAARRRATRPPRRAVLILSATDVYGHRVITRRAVTLNRLR